MAGFNLTAQLQLQAPTNTPQVVSQIQKQLKGVNVPLNVQSNAKNLANINSQLKTTDKTARGAAKSTALLNRNITEAARRFSVITVATGTFIALGRAIKNSVGSAIEFEREMVKISQVTGKTVGQLSGLQAEVTRLSTGFGVANQSLLETARILSQAGLSAVKTRQALDILAKTTLAPTFDNIIDTTEGAIAILNQFGREAAKTGQEIKFLEVSLDAISQVSKQFAVESSDLITAVRRTGGVFQAAGGNLKELIALFTSVRQTTRESAETIATGFRTIFTRLQRTETLDALKELGISLTDLEGKFIGPMKAIERLSIGLAGLDPKDARFNEIVEQLGGFRQIGKVIPLLKQYSVAQKALAVANNSSGSTAKDAITAQQSLSVQFDKVRESFDALMRKFSASDTFKSLAKDVLKIADAFLNFAKTLEQVLPQLTALAAIKIGKNLAPGIVSMFSGGGGGQRKQFGGTVSKFARGGHVPGTGNSDTVPAMLTPGEFVIKKSSAAKLGPGTLSAMNENRFAEGGKNTTKISKARKIADGKSGLQAPTLTSEAGAAKNAILSILSKEDAIKNGALDVAGAFLQPVGIEKNLKADAPGKDLKTAVLQNLQKKYKMSKEEQGNFKKQQKTDDFNLPVNIYSGSTQKKTADGFKGGMANAIGKEAESLAPEGMNFLRPKFDSALQSVNIEQIEGGIFEAWLAGLSNKPYGDTNNANDTWDFKSGVGGSLANFFGIPGNIETDAKRTFSDDSISSIVKKAATDFISQNSDDVANAMQLQQRKPPKKKAAGGSVSGSDSVPALLTPGEYVVNKSAAQSIGYSNLANMNKSGVARFAKGGAVGGIQRFNIGGEAQAFNTSAGSGLSTIDFSKLQASVNKDASILESLGQKLAGLQASSEVTTEVAKRFSRAMSQGATEQESWNHAIAIGEKSAAQLASEMQRGVSKESGAGGEVEGREALSFSGDEMAHLAQQADVLAAEFAIMGEDTRAGQKANLAYRQSIQQGATEAEAFAAGMGAGEKHQKQMNDEMDKLRQDMISSGKSKEEMIKAEEDYKKKLMAAPVGGAGAKGGGGGPLQKTEKKTAAELQKSSDRLKNFSEQAQKMGSAMNSVATAAIGVTFIAGTVIESMSSLDAESKRVAQAFVNTLSANVAMYAQIGSLVLETASAIAASRSKSLADKAGKVSMGGLSTAANNAAIALNRLGSSGGGGGGGENGPDIGSLTDNIDAGDVDAPTGKGGVNAGMMALAGAAMVTAGVMSYLAAATAAAVESLEIAKEKFLESGDRELEKIGQPGEVASEEEFVDSRVKAASAELSQLYVQQEGATKRNIAAVAGGVAGVAAFALAANSTAAGMIAAGIGLQTIPIVGNAVGAALIGAAAAAIAITAAIMFWQVAINDAAEREAQRQSLLDSITSDLAITTFRSTKALADFDASLKTAKDNNLNAVQSLSVLVSGIDGMANTFDEGADRLKNATANREKLERQLVEEGLLTKSGTVTTEGEDATGGQKESLSRLETVRKAEEEARGSQNKLLGSLMAQEQAIRTEMSAAISGTVNELKASGNTKDLAAFTGLDSAMDKTNTQFAALQKVIKTSRDKFKQLNERKFAPQIKEAEDAGDFKKEDALRKQKTAELAVNEAELAKQAADSAVAIQKSIIAENRAIAIQREMRKAMDDSNNALKGFNDVLMLATDTAKNFAQIDDATSVRRGSGGQFDAIQLDASALNVPFQQISDKALQEAGNRANINQGGQTAFDGSGMASNIANIKTLINAIPDAMESTVIELDKKLPAQKDALIAKIGKFVNLTGDQLKNTKAGKIIQKQVNELFEDKKSGRINSADYDKLIADLEEVAQAELEVLKRSIEIQNQFLQKMDQVNKAIIDAQNRYAEASARVVDVQERSADRIADATGKPRSTAAKESGRLGAAQRRLGGKATSAGAIAGNVGATAAALNKLTASAEKNRKNARKEQSKKSGADADALNKFSDNANAASNAAAKAKKELERMADQSARAGDIMAEISEEQKKRGQLKDVGENLAFGSDEQRKGIAEGFKNVQLAVGQGSMQGATDEQRASIKSTLDSLADVEIGGTGKTGREIKATLQADEIMRLTGNQELANASFDQAMAGSKEEQLLQQLADIGKEEAAAAAALAQFQLKEIDVLNKIAENTDKAFRKDIKANQNANKTNKTKAQQDASDKTDSDIQTNLDTAFNALNGYVDTNGRLIKGALENQAAAAKALQGATDLLTAAITKNADLDANQTERRSKIDNSASGKLLAGVMDTQSLYKSSQHEANDGGTQAAKDYQPLLDRTAGGSDDALRENTFGNDSELMDLDRGEIDTDLGHLFDGYFERVKNDAAAMGITNAQKGELQAAIDLMMLKSAQQLDEIRQGTADTGDFGTAKQQETRAKSTGVVGFGDVFDEEMERVVAVLRGFRDEASKASIAQGNANGGLIYRANGGSIFQPKGTDTVPAMLTPGEFVIRKSAVDQIGVGALAALNNGDAGATYKAGGGLILPSPGIVGSTFSKALQQGNMRNIRTSLESAGYDDPSQIIRSLKALSTSGKINASDIGGAKDYDKLLGALGGVRQFLASADPLTFKGPNLEGIPTDASGIESAVNALTGYRGSLKVASTKFDSVLGKGGNEKALKFASTFLQASQVTDKSIYDQALAMAMAIKVEMSKSKVGKIDEQFQSWKATSDPAMAAGMDKKEKKANAAKRQGLEAGLLQTLFGKNDPFSKGLVGKQQARGAKTQEQADEKQRLTREQNIKESLNKKQQIAFDYLVGERLLTLAAGGGVPGGGDTVPAMLTPGEYVMSNQAVAKYGVGYMKNLNRGRVPGFNKGGLVGQGNVQYRQDGGSIGAMSSGVLGLDASNVQAVLDNFNASFGSSIDNMIQQFSTFSTSMTSLAGSIAQGMDVRLSITGDLTTAVSLDGDQADHVKRAIADAVVPELIEKVSSQIDQKFNELRNSP